MADMDQEVITVAKALFTVRHPMDDWDIYYGWFKKAMQSPEFAESQKLSPSHIMSAAFRDAVVAVHAMRQIK
jgi:hypothetical protein